MKDRAPCRHFRFYFSFWIYIVLQDEEWVGDIRYLLLTSIVVAVFVILDIYLCWNGAASLRLMRPKVIALGEQTS